jgi:hypothetical protein
MIASLRRRWSKEDLEYVRLLVTTLLLVLLLPLVLHRVWSNPTGMADRALGSVVR